MSGVAKLILISLSVSLISAFSFWHFSSQQDVVVAEVKAVEVTLTKEALNSSTWNEIPAFFELAEASASARVCYYRYNR